MRAFQFVGMVCFTSALDNGLALTPPMGKVSLSINHINPVATKISGWCSWNHFHRGFNESVFYAHADIISSNGMKDMGYEFINVGACVKPK